MPPFERAPQSKPESEPPNRQVTSRHTANHGEKLYDVYKLIDAAEDIPEENAPIEMFEGHKESKFWHDKKGQWLGPSEIIALAEKHRAIWDTMLQDRPDWAEHTASVRDANYEKYPLLVVGDNHVIDGMHRLTKAWIDGVKDLSIKRFESLPPEAEIKE